MERFKYEITIRGVDGDVTPETTRLRDVIDTLEDINTALLDTAKALGCDVSVDPLLSLIDVKKSSNRLVLSVGMSLVSCLAAMNHAVAKNDYQQIPISARKAMYSISQRAEARNWEVLLPQSRRLKIQRALISRDHAVPNPEGTYGTVCGVTRVFGYCARVGGTKSPSAEIRLHTDGRPSMAVHASKEVAKQLARYLYEDVVIDGEASWRTDNWSMVSFTAQRVIPFEMSSVSEAFDELRRATGGVYDNVNPQAFVRSLR